MKTEGARDTFFDVIGRYMLPMERLDRVVDSTYFLRKNLSFVFAQGYHHPPGGFYGKLINFPDERGILNIFGRRYGTTNKRLVNGELELIPIDEQLAIHYRVEPSLEKSENLPPFARYHTRFLLDDCLGFFDHRRSLRVAMEMYPWLAEPVEKISGFLGTRVEKLGATGSLAYGKMEPEHEDLDLAIYGSVEEHSRMIRKINEWISAEEHRVFEFGRYWPMRFYYEGILVCPFFIYDRPDEIPLADFEMERLREDVPFSGVVVDDTHSIYLPVIVRLGDLRLDGDKADDMPLILYDSSIRGEYRNGDRLSGRGEIVGVRTKQEEYSALLVTLGAVIEKN